LTGWIVDFSAADKGAVVWHGNEFAFQRFDDLLILVP